MGGYILKIMCLSPVTIINPSKYISTKFRDRYLLQVPCNTCAECQERISSEWLFRTYYEFKRCLENGGFVMFDTLTYDEEHLPHLSDIAKEFPYVPCFRSKDITDFFKRLRITFDRKFNNVSVRYFLCSEYGSKFGRPHYHLLLFVNGNISPTDVSRFISHHWKFGRTDGMPYKNAAYVLLHNTIRSSRTGDILAAANYVTKYVQKDCHLQSVLDLRIKRCNLIISNNEIPFVKSNSVKASRLRQKIKTEVNQFHVQSLGFGESYLEDLDMLQIFRDGYLTYPSIQSVRTKIAIPIYFKRKLFYDKVIIDNNPLWTLNEDGLKFVEYRKPFLLKMVADRFKCLSILSNMEIDSVALADYVLNYRGRYIADKESSCLSERLSNVTHYNYVTRTDKENVGIGVSMDFIGNSSLGYAPLSNFLPLKKFIADNVYFNSQYENILEKLYNSVRSIDKSKQEYFSLRQRLTALYKNINPMNF